MANERLGGPDPSPRESDSDAEPGVPRAPDTGAEDGAPADPVAGGDADATVGTDAADARVGAGTDAGTDARDGPPLLELDGVRKRFGDEQVLCGLSLSVREGELLTLLGPSGCGKTTTLRLIAGLDRPDAGDVRLGGDSVVDEFVPAEERDVGVVFQEFALFPHMSVAENVAFGIDDWPADERAARVDELLDLVGLADHRDGDPETLSGGQRQRVALARSLAPEPELLLLDEPFSNLDVDLRVEMREEVRSILTEAGVTAISVTHDQEEALSISDRVAVLHDGQIEQVGPPEEMFQHPRSRFVAGFLGHASFLRGYVSGDAVQTPLGPIDRDRVYVLADEYDETAVDVLVRPDDVTAVPASEAEADGRVTYRRYLGPSVLYRVSLDDGGTVECMHNHAERLDLDQPVSVRLTAAHDLAWFPTESDAG